MAHFSAFYGIEVRDEMAREFTDVQRTVDDMLAGLHQVRARMMESRTRPVATAPESGSKRSPEQGRD